MGSAVSRPTAFKVKYRWYIPRFIYQMVINDITDITINAAPSACGVEEK